MPPSDPELAARLPLLFARQRWEWAGVDASFSTTAPAPELVTNVHVIAFVDERIVLCRDDRDVWFLPGGTRERGETIDDCAARELTEEAGASLGSPLSWVGAHRCVSDRPGPFRPHQPHPETAWLWCSATVRIDSAPTNPEDGENIVEVRVSEPEEAQHLLLTDEPWSPELLRLALLMRGLPQSTLHGSAADRSINDPL